ncbi:hypothetical protein RND81_02G083800 [Saponaria officinalis]|uniref:Retrovirus-related Pol polyprotein from transposon TNT 1-94-like beta-barrel domain-containing protein n=1 Tax=Saponaria officinalis TaxID=3572 RepID=A0AAW1MR61_SAPOF
MLLMAYADKDRGNCNNLWFLNSGCSNHMCGDYSLFCDFDKNFKQTVRLGNNMKMSVVGKGNIKLLLKDTTYVVREVFYVPELKNHLLSIGQLQEKGLDVLFKSNQCQIYHPTKGLIIQAYMTANRMFVVKSETQSTEVQLKSDICLRTTTKDGDVTELWHKRYGHL